MFAATKGNNVVEGSPPSSCSPNEVCGLHKDKLLEVYCRDHDEIICATCLAMNHSTCKDVHSIPDEVDGLYQERVFDETIRKLTTMMKTMQGIRTSKANVMKELEQNKIQAIESIKQFREELEAELERLEAESITEVKAEYENIKAKLQRDIRDVEECDKEMKRFVNKLEALNGNKAQEFISIKAAWNAIKKANQFKESQKDVENTEIVFAENTKLQDYLEDLETIGRVSTTRTPLKLPSCPEIYTVTKQKEINVKLPKESVSHIYGSCFTEEGSLLLTDFGNRKLKRLDLSLESVVDSLYLMDFPMDVCLTRKHEAAVSLCSNIIQFVTIGTKIAATKQLKLDHHCFGLAFKDDKLFISDEKAAVYLHDIEGNLIRKVTTNRSGNAIFSATRHICTDHHGDKVYVADLDKGLVTLDKQGNYDSTITSRDLTKLSGVCSDERGNIILTGQGASDIVQISTQSKMKVAVLEKVKDSFSTCFDPQQNKLIVNQGNSTIQVYELK